MSNKGELSCLRSRFCSNELEAITKCGAWYLFEREDSRVSRHDIYLKTLPTLPLEFLL